MAKHPRKWQNDGKGSDYSRYSRCSGLGDNAGRVIDRCVQLCGARGVSGDLLLEPIRSELRKRIHVTNIDQVRVVLTELGPWAGAIGAAIHGADSVQNVSV